MSLNSGDRIRRCEVVNEYYSYFVLYRTYKRRTKYDAFTDGVGAGPPYNTTTTTTTTLIRGKMNRPFIGE